MPSEMKLPKLNRMLEAVMGWQGYHLHMFEIADLRIGAPDEDDDDVIDERPITLKQLLPRVGFDPDAFDQTVFGSRLRQVR